MKTSAGAFAAWAYIDRDKNHPSDNSNGDTRVLYNEQGEYIDTLMDERSRYKVFSAGEEADVLLFSELIVPTDSSHDPTQPKQGISLLHDNYDQLRVQIRLTNIVGGADSNTMTFSRDEVIKALTNQSKTEIRVPLSPHAECPNNTK
ncbi:hypothetical protein WH50_04180 [Pokkaliibacter plantistimulans]|uniref:Uncharacterized protein n=2 Tax=Pokkaliibacter plantistimulans TaxID=1635171 RepID=A0ABX5M295_9GAMM|nr:hypothetical protein WH50_04180 [Pokkaliibacter plantistimulans]